jgi:hypothetical protein
MPPAQGDLKASSLPRRLATAHRVHAYWEFRGRLIGRENTGAIEQP